MSKSSKSNVLHIENDKAERSVLKQVISDQNLPYQIISAYTEEEIEGVMAKHIIDAAVVHVREDDPRPFDLLRALEHLPSVVLAEGGNGKTIRKALRHGAVDFIIKDEEGQYFSAIPEGLQRAVQKSKEIRARKGYQQELEQIVSDRAQVLLEANQRLTVEAQQRLDSLDAQREAETRYTMIFNSTSDAVFIHTLQGELLDVNDAACERLGFTRAELLERTVDELTLDPALIPSTQIEKLTKEGQLHLETDIQGKNSTATPVELKSRMMEFHGRRAVLTIVRDITQRKEVESALAEREEEHRKTVHQQAVIESLTNELRATMDLEKMYESVLSHIRDLLDVDYFILYRVKGKQLILKYVWGGDRPLDPDFFPRISHLAEKRLTPLGLALQDGRVVNVPDLAEMAGKNQTHYQFDVHGQLQLGGEPPENAKLTRSALLAPLMVEAEEISIFEIQSFKREAYQERDEQLLKRIASTVAIVLQKSYLLDSLQKQNQRLKALHLIDQAITENQSLPMMLDTLRDQLVSLLDVDAADILYYHSELKALKIITQTGFRTNPMRYTELQLGEDPAGEAAFSRRTVHLPDIRDAETAFQRSPDFDQEDFVSYIGVPLIAKGDLVGVLEVFHRELLDVDQEWIDFLETLAGQAAIAIGQRNLYKNLRRSKDQLDEAYDSIIESWAQAMEMREIETTGHGQRLVDLSLKVARRLGVKGKKIDNIRRGAYLHDIGKMGIPDRILKKEEKLTKEEREEIGKHPLYAYEILRSNEYLRPALDIPLYHHERWDGLGYPEGLKGKEIPLAARIFAVVDVWDALRSGRPYRKAWSDERALAHIEEESGKHFDPQVVKAFLEVVER